MAYIGQGIKQGTFKVLDTSGNTYNGSNTTFSLGTQVGSAAQLLVSHDGVIQKAGTDYTLATGGTQITFSTAPASGASIFITEISGAVGGTVTPSDTSVTADTDDQIDIKVAGTDQITIKDGALSPVTDNDIDLGTSSLEFKDAFFDGTVTTDGLTVSGTPSFADGSIAIADLDIDGGTDIGADIADADLFIIDDGAGGTNRKVAASRIKTYAGGATAVVAGGNLTSNTSELDIQSISGYKFYTLFLNNIKSINNNYDMKMRINGYTSSTYEYFNRYYKVDSSGSNVVTQNNSGDNNWPFMGDDLGNNDDEGLSLRIDFFAGGGQTKAAWVGFGRDDNHADGHRVFGSGQVDSVGLSRIQIYSGGGNIKASGSYPMEYTLIGYNQS